MNIHVLLPKENNPVDRLVLRTLSVGFPTCEIKITDNSNYHHTHASWLCETICNEQSPFWVTDTDVVFFGPLDHVDSDYSILGRHEPAFYEKWLDVYKTERIHTCVMRINPIKLRLEFEQYLKKFNVRLLERFGFEFSLMEFIRGSLIPTNTKPLLYDTMSKLYNIVSCSAFTIVQNLQFEHLHAGSYASDVTHIGQALGSLHSRVCEDLNVARGLQFEQQRYYEENRIIYGQS